MRIYLTIPLDKIFSEDSKTKDVFDGWVLPQLPHLKSNQNVTVLMYGYSGSGKTFTTFGDEKSPGIVDYAIEYIEQHFDGNLVS